MIYYKLMHRQLNIRYSLKKKGRNLFWRWRKRDFERKEREIWKERERERSTHFPTPVRLPGPSHHPPDHRSEC